MDEKTARSQGIAGVILLRLTEHVRAARKMRRNRWAAEAPVPANTLTPETIWSIAIEETDKILAEQGSFVWPNARAELLHHLAMYVEVNHMRLDKLNEALAEREGMATAPPMPSSFREALAWSKPS